MWRAKCSAVPSGDMEATVSGAIAIARLRSAKSFLKSNSIGLQRVLAWNVLTIAFSSGSIPVPFSSRSLYPDGSSPTTVDTIYSSQRPHCKGCRIKLTLRCGLLKSMSIGLSHQMSFHRRFLAIELEESSCGVTSDICVSSFLKFLSGARDVINISTSDAPYGQLPSPRQSTVSI